MLMEMEDGWRAGGGPGLEGGGGGGAPGLEPLAAPQQLHMLSYGDLAAAPPPGFVPQQPPQQQQVAQHFAAQLAAAQQQQQVAALFQGHLPGDAHALLAFGGGLQGVRQQLPPVATARKEEVQVRGRGRAPTARCQRPSAGPSDTGRV